MIGDKHTPASEVWLNYHRIIERSLINSLEMAWEDWQKSHNYGTLADRTKQDYKDCSARPLKAFKGWDVSQIDPSDVYQYLQLRGKESLRRANYELTWMNHVLRQAVSEGYIPENPCRDIQPLRIKKARKRYVTDFDYRGMYAKATAPVRVAMEISYCTGIRQGDVLKMRWEDLGESMHVIEGKTGREYLKLLSPRLQAALELAKKLPGHQFGGWVVRTRTGGRYTSKGFQANWKRAKSKLPKHRRFVFHEIRHKAITDAKGDKLAFSMHSDAKMLGVYDHELPVSPSH
jgi:integrase